MLNRKYFNLFQLLVAGASEVGKTSLIHRFTDDYFTAVAERPGNTIAAYEEGE